MVAKDWQASSFSRPDTGREVSSRLSLDSGPATIRADRSAALIEVSRTQESSPPAAEHSPSTSTAGDGRQLDPRQLQWRVIEPSARWRPRLGLRELWDHGDLALVLAARDLKLRYRQTFFGVAWAVLQPLAGMAIFSLVFGRLADLPSDGLPYPLFVLTGLALWFPISTAVTSAAESLVEHQDLVSKVWFPRPLAPVAAVLATGVDLVVSLTLLIPVMAAYAVTPTPQVLTLPLWVGGALVVATGAGLWLSAANVLYRDVRYALTFLLQVWFFATPVVFPSSLADGAASYVLALNPVAGLVDGLRWALLDGPAPGASLALSAATAIMLLVSGALYFRSAERSFADRI
jgi:lipopolysaccharide transport system permease protein